MSSPTRGISDSGPKGALQDTPSRDESPCAVPPSGTRAQLSALALSGLLEVQRPWHSTSEEPAGRGRRASSSKGPLPQPAAGTVRWRVRVQLEEPEWSRFALGLSADALNSLGVSKSAQVLQLGPDSVTVHLPSPERPSWPFVPGRLPWSWDVARETGLVASLPVTTAITRATGRAGLVTFSEMHGRRVLVDLVAVGTTVLRGAPQELGVKLAEIAVELASRRWSDLESIILVSFDQPMPRLAGTTRVPNLAAALDEITARAMGEQAACVIVPPWACDEDDALLAELLTFCGETAGLGMLCCASTHVARCLWDLDNPETGSPTLRFSDGRHFTGVDLGDMAVVVKAPPTPAAAPRRVGVPDPPQAVRAIEICLLGNVQVEGAPESFRYRRRLTELVAFLAMHPEGSTSDSFATALWPERRVPVQTLANRLSETRRALGIASDGLPRLRKMGRRHLIADVETDWKRFKELSAPDQDPESWRRALALVRGRPFDGLERGEWAQLEGFSAAIEASIVDVACRLGDHALGRGEAGLTHWAALQGLLASPWDERLYRLLMRAADGLGNRGGVDAALRSLALALELEGDPLLGIHPETSALYRRLTSRSSN